MSNRKMLLICSFFFLIVTIGLLILSFKTKYGLNFNALLTLSLSVLSFNVWYVYPHINKHDERAKFIKKKNHKLHLLFHPSLFDSIFYIKPIHTKSTDKQLNYFVNQFHHYYIVIYHDYCC